jgi:hypothetical protein
MTDSLFKPKRICCVCLAESTNGSRKPIAGEPNIIAISPLIYRRGSGKAQLRNAGRVQICEECLTKALTSGRLGWMSDKSAKLWTAMRSALLDCYSAMSEGDAKH